MRSALFFIFLLVAIPVKAQTAAENYRQGVQCYQQGQYDKALEFFKQTLRLAPENAPTYQMMGQVYYAEGNLPEAISKCEMSLTINPNNPALVSFVAQMKQKALQVEATSVPGANGASAHQPSVQDNLNPQLARNGVYWKGLTLGWGDEQYFDDYNNAVNQFTPSGQTAHVRTSPPSNESDTELVWKIDANNGLSISYGGIANNAWEAYYGTYYQGGYALIATDQFFEAQVYFAELRYYRYLNDRDGRWYGSVGIGYYWGTVDYNLDDETSNDSISANNLTGSTIGFTLTVGREIPLFWILGLDLSVEARYANIAELTQGNMAFVKYTNGSVGVVQGNALTSTAGYQSLSVTGINGRAGINLYF